MILILRLILLVIVAVLRLGWRTTRRRASGELDGRRLFVVLQRRPKSKEITGFRIGVELRAPLVLNIHRERPSDRWFKALGLSREVQTGDDAFDCLVYVACDHSGMHELLQQSAPLRAAIRAAFAAGFDSITHDGIALWLDRKSTSGPGDEDRAVLAQLAHELRDLDRALAMRRAPYVWRALGCEAVAWGVAAFGIASFPVAMYSLGLSLSVGELLALGLGGALAGFIVLESLVILVLRGSSRARLVLIECTVLFAVAFPAIGVQSAVDLNERAGSVISESGERTLLESKKRRSGSARRRRTTYTFILESGGRIGGCEIPTTVQVSGSLYAEVQPGERVEITVSSGALGLKWMELRAARTSTSGGE